MLRVIGTDNLEADKGQLVCDGYIPLKFCASNEVLLGSFLWRTGDFKTSLLEFKINPTKGTIETVTLVCHSGTVQPHSLFSCGDFPVIHGLPVVDVRCFPSQDYPRNRIDKPSTLTIAFYNDNLEIAFNNKAKISHLIRNNNFIFVIDCNDQICGVVAVELSREQILNVSATLNLSPNDLR